MNTGGRGRIVHKEGGGGESSLLSLSRRCGLAAVAVVSGGGLLASPACCHWGGGSTGTGAGGRRCYVLVKSNNINQGLQMYLHKALPAVVSTLAALWESWSTPWAARRPSALAEVG